MARSFTLLLFFSLAATFSAPAQASLQLSFGSGDVLALAVPGSNNFATQIETALGASSGGVKIVRSDITATADGTIEFFAHASESGFVNRFEILGQLLTGLSTFTETSDIAWTSAGISFATISVEAGDVLSGLIQFATNGGVTPNTANPGDGGFGIFLRNTATSADGHTTLYFGYDDLGAGPDSDFDDLIISAVFTPSPTGGTEEVPESASIAAWSLLAGLGIIAVRRSRRC